MIPRAGEFARRHLDTSRVQEFKVNQRKDRHGAFWEDRYQATAIQADEHLHRCLVYIDLNMVRAGVVRHPEKCLQGYHEIQHPSERYAVIDQPALIALCGFTEAKDFQQAHRRVAAALESELTVRDARWSAAIAVGNLAFVAQIKSEIGVKAIHRAVMQLDGACALREQGEPYGHDFASESDAIRRENNIPWDKTLKLRTDNVVRSEARG